MKTDLDAMSESQKHLLQQRGLPLGTIQDWPFREEIRAHVRATREAHEFGWRAAHEFYRAHPEFLES